jgi:hypothetical protein
MAEAIVLALYAPLIVLGSLLVWRRPVRALYAFVVGLALHNLVMAELWDAGVRGIALDVVASWKETLLAVALASTYARRRGTPYKATSADALALAYAGVVVLYAVLPQRWLGGSATGEGVLLALRHDLVPVAAYFLGRGLQLGGREFRRVAVTAVATAAAVAAFGLFDVWAISLDEWRRSGVPGWFREQLGLEYRGLSGLPENFVYNPGDEQPLRRLVSTFLSPLATSYLLVVALFLLAAIRPRGRVLVPLVALLGAGLLFTYSRSSFLALAVGLAILAAGLRRWWPLAAAAAVLFLAVAFVKAYPDLGPETRFTAAELAYQREQARSDPGVSHDPLSAGESSISSHWRNLRDGVETVLTHPWGYGLGNAGATAARTDVELKAGESSYTELGVDAGLAGALLFIAWNVVLVWRLLPRAPWLAAALAAVLALGIQTDVVGVPWVAYVLWALVGARVSGESRA